jgi:putative transposase
MTKAQSPYYIDIQLESIPPKPSKSRDALGVDVGRTDIAVTSEGEKWNGKEALLIW